MQHTVKAVKSHDPDFFLPDSLEPIISALGMKLIEFSVSRRKGRSEKSGPVQVRAVVMSDGVTGLEDCSRVHRAIMPRLELAFPEREIYLEVSSPGIERIIKDACEFVYYIGRGIKCYRTDISDWTAGILISADEKKLVLKKEDGEISLEYDVIAKAKLDCSALTEPGVLPRGT